MDRYLYLGTLHYLTSVYLRIIGAYYIFYFIFLIHITNTPITRSKNIDHKFCFVKEKVVESLISVEHKPTTSMLTNPLTKDLPIYVFQEHVTRMGLLGA